MSHVVSLRLRDEQMARMSRLARRFGRTVSETSAMLLEETMRMAEFAYIQFRDSPAGRQAYISGSGLAVWEVALIAQAYHGDIIKTAEHLQWPVIKVRAALNYATTYPKEIEDAIRDNELDFEHLNRMLPGAQRLSLDDLLRDDDERDAQENAE